VGLKHIQFIFILCAWLLSSLAYSLSNKPDPNDGPPLDITIMLPCNTMQPLETEFGLNKAAKSSNYCAFDGRYVTKPHWNSDVNPISGSGKILQGQTDYKVGRDILNGKGYRLPTLNELLRLVNFNVNRAAPADQLFSDYEVVNNWFKTSPTDFLDGYIVSSTFDKSSKNVYGIDIASRHIVKLNPSAIYTNPAATPLLITDNTATAPTDRPLLILGVSDYFQMVNLSENKCLGVTPPDPDVYSRVSIKLEGCDNGSIYQRWKFNDGRLYAQARDTDEYCVNMSDGTLDTPSADCTFISDHPDFNQEGTIKNNSDQYLKINISGSGSSLSDNENEGTQWFLQY
jgi:hypothetical protein